MHILSWGGVGGPIASLVRPAFSCEIRERLCRAARDRASDESRAKQLVIGNLRSYGDEVICPHGNYLQTTLCDRILEVDAHADTVTAECGVRLDILQNRVASFGYMLPVTPGTAYLTLGGAIANDVHGKNHHRAGTFGCYVDRFELVRTSGEVILCSRTERPELFAATIGGMGLTGAITWARIQLQRLDSPFLEVTSYRFRDLNEFFDLDLHSKDHEYSVAWVDCAAKGRSLGRGIYSVADHAPSAAHPSGMERRAGRRGPNVPFYMPVSPINYVTLSVMNAIYYRLHPTGSRSVHYANWLYPLDSVGSWNRLYGRRGFFQFQCAVPPSEARSSIREMLKTIATAGQGSCLVVLKNFGDKASPGLMSFPMPGATLALDFPNRGNATRELLLELYRITVNAGGRLYPAKDACSPVNSLEMGYPNFARFRELIDPGLESSMSRRLALTA
jgi:FAD/FMN-containing dehydrogenase